MYPSCFMCRKFKEYYFKPYSRSKNILQIRDAFIACGCHQIWEIKDVTEVHHLIMWWWCISRSRVYVANPNCMGKDKGTVYVAVTGYGCINACLELVLPAKHHYPMELLEIFLLPLLLLYHWGQPGRNHLCDGELFDALHEKIVMLYHGVGCHLWKSHHHCWTSNNSVGSRAFCVIEVSMSNV